MERYAVLKWGYTVGVQGESVFIDFDPGELVIAKSVSHSSYYSYYRICKLDSSVSFNCNGEDFDFLEIKWLEIRVK
jgi:hypothetical protein